MRQKELRIALVCYGGVSLAVYMHGVTKELWKVLRASQAARSSLPEDVGRLSGSETVYLRLLRHLKERKGLQLRVMTDIIAGASAGGINAVFLAQAIQTGQSLEPLTGLWLDCADVDALTDPDARPWSRIAKFWASPIVSFLLRRPGNAVSASVAAETRKEVRTKLSRLIRSRWFEPPFSGINHARVLWRAFDLMTHSEQRAPLLPERHPLDLSVTTTDFGGHLQTLRLHSPTLVLESEHRMPIRFCAQHRRCGKAPSASLAALPELVLAARATSSFPGAFPPMQIAEIDRLVAENGGTWSTREVFLARIMPDHARRGDIDRVSLIDGSVLVNAPFSDAMRVLHNRPAAREVDRRFVYIDPNPGRTGSYQRQDSRVPGFFSVIFGSLSAIPREQPVRDNLETLEHQSREAETLRTVIRCLRPDVERAVGDLFGGSIFLHWPNPKRLKSWRHKAQQKAFEQAGFTYQGYAQVKFNGVVAMLARLARDAAPDQADLSEDRIALRLHACLAEQGLNQLHLIRHGNFHGMVEFLRAQDLDFRIRRLRLLARRVTQEWEHEESLTEAHRDKVRTVIYAALAVFLELEAGRGQPALAAAAAKVMTAPEAFLAQVAATRNLLNLDEQVDTMLCEMLSGLPSPLRRRILMTYLGFPFYDTATLPLFRGTGLNEFEPIKVDRISPEDCSAITADASGPVLRGTEFFNFGAFFSRAYRENDYLWGRLHGAERMIDLIGSTLDPENAMSADELLRFKHQAFQAILDEETPRLQADPHMIANLRNQLQKSGEEGRA